MASDGSVIIDVTLDGAKALAQYNQLGSKFSSTTGALGSAAGKMGSIIKGAGVAAAAGAAAAGAAAIALGKSVVSSYADYEQLVGGVDTLFKDASGTVQKFADDAFKTAGMSANEYMETVTGFSASLIQSLGGDTKKAAQVGNMAVTDMSDNANKMGTSMGMIQNAYQGFAKQNYTMLDNLKLGYGGTQEEMKRLLADAEKISGVKYDISKFSDVAEAIHVIQTEMDITGTTAKEAAHTIEGSINSTKAAYQNLLTGLGNPKANIDKLVNDLVESFTNVIINITPVIQNLVKALPGALATLVSAAGKAISDNLGISIGSGLSKTMGSIQKSIAPLSDILQNSFKNIGPMITNVISSLEPLGNALANTLGLIPQLFANVITSLSPVMDSLGTAFQQIPQLLTTVVGAIGPIISSISNAFTQLDFSGIQDLITAILPALQNAFVTVMDIIKPSLDTLINSFVKMWNAIQPLISVLAGALMPVLQVLGAFIGGVLKGAMLSLSAVFDTIRVVAGFLTPIIQAVVNAFKEFAPVLSTVAQWIGVAIGFFGNLGAAGTSLKSLLSSAWNGIKSIISTVVSGIGGIINTAKAIFSSLGSAGGALRNVISTAWNGIRSIISAVGSAIGGTINGIKSFFSGLSASGNSLRSVMSGVWNGISSIVSGAASSISGIISGIRGTFNSLWNIDLSGAGRAIIDGFIGGLKSTWEAGKNFIGGIADWIKQHKGPISYDRKLLIPAGNAIMESLNEGLQDNFVKVQKNVSGMADKLLNEFNPELPDFTRKINIGSDFSSKNPSRVQKAKARNEESNNLLKDVVREVQNLKDRATILNVNGRELAYATANDNKQAQERLTKIENLLWGGK